MQEPFSEEEPLRIERIQPPLDDAFRRCQLVAIGDRIELDKAAFRRAAKQRQDLSDIADRVAKANGELKAATMWFVQNGLANPNNAGAGAHHYMHIAGIVGLGLMWLRMAKVAAERLDGGAEDKRFYEAKLVTARYFAERFVPDAGALRRKIEAGSQAMMALDPDIFAAG